MSALDLPCMSLIACQCLSDRLNAYSLVLPFQTARHEPCKYIVISTELPLSQAPFDRFGCFLSIVKAERAGLS